MIQQISTLVKKTTPQKASLDINDVIHEVAALVQSEVRQHRVALCLELAAAPPPVLGDRVQVQQILLNLMPNGIEAMYAVTDRPRELLISTQRQGADALLVTVQGAGSGLDPQTMDRLFDAFFTTKSTGMGMRLTAAIPVVDDEPGVVRALAHLLRRRGHEVDTAANGRLALEKLQTQAFDLILSSADL